MGNDASFVNLYIEKLLNEIGELNKTKILMATQLAYNELVVKDLVAKNESLVATTAEQEKTILALKAKKPKA